VKVYVYKGAGHGFNSDRRTDYNDEAHKLGMKRTLELFHANGG
jgi:carboxymethylenebutenolidase